MRAVFSVFPVVMLCAVLMVSGCGGKSGKILLDDGLNKLQKGDNSAAVSLLEKASVKLQSDPTVHYHLGVAYLNLGRKDKAEASFRKAASLAPEDPAPLEFLAQVSMSNGKWNEAREVLAQADQLAPGIPRILNSMAVAEIHSGDARRAYTYLMNATEKDAGYAAAYYNLGVLYRDRVDSRDMAVKFFKKYLQVDPNGSHAATAREAIKPLVAARASPADPILKKARDAVRKESFDEAIELYEQAFKKDPATPDSLWEIASLYEKIKNSSKAVECYSLFKKQFSGDQRASRASLKIEDLRDSGKPASTAPVQPGKTAPPVIVDPFAVSVAKVAFDEAFRRQGVGDFDGAITFYKRACQLDASYAEAFFNMGLVCRQQGNLAQAKSAFSSASKLKANNAKFRYMLALTYRDLKDNDKAIQELNKILRTQPDYADAYLILGVIYRDGNRPDMSKKYFDLYQEFQKPKP
jgi:tetratricopeptide (TPR) repeat protein